MGNKLKRMALIAHIQINKWRWFNAHSDKAGGNGGIGEEEWREAMEGCERAIRGAQAAEVELTAFVTVCGVEVWPIAAVDQPPPQSHALTAQTQCADCVSVIVCMCVSLRPAPQTHCEVFLLSSSTPPFLLTRFFFSFFQHLSIPLSVVPSTKKAQVFKLCHLHNTLWVYPLIRLSTQSIYPTQSLHNNNCQPPLPPIFRIFCVFR